MNKKTARGWKRCGVTLLDPTTTYIDSEVRIEAGCVIEPNVSLLGSVILEEGNRIGSNSVLRNCTLGKNNRIYASFLEDVKMKDENIIGPFAHLHDDVRLGSRNEIGNYVELKKTRVESDNKMKHLSYIGDAVIGNRNNLGASTITANFRKGSPKKEKTTIANDTYLGSHVTLIAPLSVNDRASIGAGSVITQDVPQDSLAIARSKETVKKDYYKEQK